MCKRFIFFLMISLFLFTGCSSTKLVSNWTKPDFSGPALKKIMVVAASENEMRRRLYEDSFAEKLRNEGVEAIASYTVIDKLDGDKEGNKKLIKAAVSKTAVDGVLIATLIGVENNERYAPENGGSYGMLIHYGYSHGIVYYHEDTFYQRQDVISSTVVRLHAAVFLAKTEEMLWAGNTKRVNPDSAVEVIDENIDLINRQLITAGIL